MASLMAQVVENLQCRRPRFDPWVPPPWRRAWQPASVLLPGESHGQRSLAGYSPWASRRIRHDWAINSFTSLSAPSLEQTCVLNIQKERSLLLRVWGKNKTGLLSLSNCTSLGLTPLTSCSVKQVWYESHSPWSMTCLTPLQVLKSGITTVVDRIK